MLLHQLGCVYMLFPPLAHPEYLPLESPFDATPWLRGCAAQLPCFTSVISGRFDVGGLASYIECNDFFFAKEAGAKTP